MVEKAAGQNIMKVVVYAFSRLYHREVKHITSKLNNLRELIELNSFFNLFRIIFKQLMNNFSIFHESCTGSYIHSSHIVTGDCINRILIKSYKHNKIMSFPFSNFYQIINDSLLRTHMNNLSKF